MHKINEKKKKIDFVGDHETYKMQQGAGQTSRNKNVLIFLLRPLLDCTSTHTLQNEIEC